MKLFPFVCLVAAAAGITAFGSDKATGNIISNSDPVADSILAALDYQLTNYPASQYRDIYKNFMQDFYGPGHILADTAAAGQYLRQELAETDSFGGPLYEPTGYRGNFYRVNLSLIRDGIVPYDIYFSNFVESVQSIKVPELDHWIAVWNTIDSVIVANDIHIAGEDVDRLMLSELFATGGYAAHHSQQYNDAVNFHYRIISHPNFESQILPLLHKSK